MDDLTRTNSAKAVKSTEKLVVRAVHRLRLRTVAWAVGLGLRRLTFVG
jgi:hypothetical protein